MQRDSVHLMLLAKIHSLNGVDNPLKMKIIANKKTKKKLDKTKNTWRPFAFFSVSFFFVCLCVWFGLVWFGFFRVNSGCRFLHCLFGLCVGGWVNVFLCVFGCCCCCCVDSVIKF